MSGRSVDAVRSLRVGPTQLSETAKPASGKRRPRGEGRRQEASATEGPSTIALRLPTLEELYATLEELYYGVPHLSTNLEKR